MTSVFRYTLNNEKLTYQQRDFYEKNGYLLLCNLVENSLLDDCIQRFKDICNGKIDKGSMTLMKDISLAKTNAKGEFLYNKVQDIVWDEVFSRYIMHPKLLDYVECFTGPNISAMHSMLINKPPDSGKLTSTHPLHQDLYYFTFRPVDRIVAAWTAMETITTRNGCLVVVPGTHKGDLLQHGYPEWENGVNKAYHGIKNSNDYKTVSLEMEKGDTVFFHPLLIHGSGPNLTNVSKTVKIQSLERRKRGNESMERILHRRITRIKSFEQIFGLQESGSRFAIYYQGAQKLRHCLQRVQTPNGKGFRKAISCHYSTSNFHHIDVTGTVQESIAKEIVDMASKKGLQVSFTDVWDYRLRVVRGSAPSHL